MNPFPKKLFVVTWFAASVTAYAASIPQWSMHEIALESQRASVNSHTDVEVTARFTGPGGVTKDMPGIWDAGRTFKVRFFVMDTNYIARMAKPEHRWGKDIRAPALPSVLNEFGRIRTAVRPTFSIAHT